MCIRKNFLKLKSINLRTKFNIPVGYDEFLLTTYGQYMIPPDEENRKTHHTYTAYKR